MSNTWCGYDVSIKSHRRRSIHDFVVFGVDLNFRKYFENCIATNRTNRRTSHSHFNAVATYTSCTVCTLESWTWHKMNYLWFWLSLLFIAYKDHQYERLLLVRRCHDGRWWCSIFHSLARARNSYRRRRLHRSYLHSLHTSSTSSIYLLIDSMRKLLWFCLLPYMMSWNKIIIICAMRQQTGINNSISSP